MLPVTLNKDLSLISYLCISVAEPKNIALGKPAWQINDYGANYKAAKAVDGNDDPLFSRNSCACTKSASYAWWSVDLKKRYEITNVEITNRQAARK